MRNHKFQQNKWKSLELPTWGVVFTVYTSWLFITLYWSEWGIGFILPTGALLIAWHNSLQHEAIHCHPTSSIFWNSIIAGIPLNLWRPYQIYRDTHLKHHQNHFLTHPTEDPESYYITLDQWLEMGSFHRNLRLCLNTFFGRILIGPIYFMLDFLWGELKELSKGNIHHLRYWILHIVGCIPIIFWLRYCEVPIWQYIFLALYPGEAINMIRSFTEHRAAENIDERIALVESNRFFSLLFLNNNLHGLHHQSPSLPWYELPSAIRTYQQNNFQKIRNYHFSGYLDIFKQYWNTPWDHPVNHFFDGQWKSYQSESSEEISS